MAVDEASLTVQTFLDQRTDYIKTTIGDGLREIFITYEGTSIIVDKADVLWLVISRSGALTEPIIGGNYNLADYVEVRMVTKNRNDFLSRAAILLREEFDCDDDYGELDEGPVEVSEKGIEKILTVSVYDC